jgi:hypothetical protein
LVLLIVALVISYLHFHYIYELFENDKHFSHLSTLERELSFRTEMGLYYSYFKQIAVDSSSFTEGFLSIISDNRTEAPTTINVLERFNLYPEVLLGFIYRVMNSHGMLTEECYKVDRGQTMSPVLSCEGHKQPIYFYVTSVFLLNGFLLGVLFLFATYLSTSIYGGLITTFAYLFNHGEATRVMWYVVIIEVNCQKAKSCITFLGHHHFGKIFHFHFIFYNCLLSHMFYNNSKL